MFVGHYATALAAKRAAPRASLALLVFATFWIDLLWPVLLLTGVEEVAIDPGNTAFTPLDFVRYPVSHSLLMVVAWGMVIGGLAWWRRDRRVGVVAGLAVVSHWVLDWVTHRPDLPLWPGGVKVGLGLWNSVAASVAAEALLLAVGLWLYMGVSRPVRARGRWAFVGLNVFFVGIWVANLLGPPPPSATVVAWSALLLWLLVPWAAWMEANRSSGSAPAA